MACAGDGWHRVGTDCRVLVQDRVITSCQKLGNNGEWKQASILRWNKEFHWYQRTGRVTLAALRSGIARSTMTIS